MPDYTDTTHYSQENDFHTLCVDWRFRMLDALRDYADSITTLDTAQWLPSLPELYGEHILSLLRELRQSAIRLTTIIDDHPVPPTNDNGEYLTLLFVDIRNPISSFSILDQIVGSTPPARAGIASEVAFAPAAMRAIT